MTDRTGLKAAANVAGEGKKSSDKQAEILSVARDRLNMAISAYSESREDQLDDLKFYAASRTTISNGLRTYWRLAARCKARQSTRVRV